VVLEYTWPLIGAPALPSGAVLLWRQLTRSGPPSPHPESRRIPPDRVGWLAIITAAMIAATTMTSLALR